VTNARKNLYVNHQGKMVVNGRVMPTTTHESKPEDEGGEAALQSEQPLVDALVTSIIREVNEMRKAGTLRPFTEGEPIGALPRLVEAAEDAVDPKYARARVMEDRRREMLALRKSNDADMRRLTQ